MDGFAFTPQHKIHSAFKVNYVTISSLAPIHLFFLTVPAAPQPAEPHRRGDGAAAEQCAEPRVARSAAPGRAGPGPNALRASGEFRFHSRPWPPRPVPPARPLRGTDPSVADTFKALNPQREGCGGGPAGHCPLASARRSPLRAPPGDAAFCRRCPAATRQRSGSLCAS